MTQLDDMMAAFKQKQNEAAKGEDFKLAFPVFYEMLQKYSDCGLFRSESAEKFHETRNNFTTNQTMDLDYTHMNHDLTYGDTTMMSNNNNSCIRFAKYNN